MSVAWQCETDPYAAQVLAHQWPDVPNLGDVHAVDWARVEPVDLICGGYPCQPFSLAGARKGDDDPRHLWPAFAGALRHLRPEWALLENVPGHLSLGFGRVLGDLAEIGYDAEWTCVSAAAAGAPHLRIRLFVVAHAERVPVRDESDRHPGRSGSAVPGDDGAPGHLADTPGPGGARPRLFDVEANPGWETAAGVGHGPVHGSPDVADTDSGRWHGGPGQLREGWGPEPADRGPAVADPGGLRRDRRPGGGRAGGDQAIGDETGSDPGDRGGPPGGAVADPDRAWQLQPEGGLAERGGWALDRRDAPRTGAWWWAAEPDVGRVAYGVPARMDRLRTLGNAVVPQVAEWVGRRIMEAS